MTTTPAAAAAPELDATSHRRAPLRRAAIAGALALAALTPGLAAATEPADGVAPPSVAAADRQGSHAAGTTAVKSVQANGARLRSRASTGSAVLALGYRGNRFTANCWIGSGSGTWYRGWLNGRAGWMHESVVSYHQISYNPC